MQSPSTRYEIKLVTDEVNLPQIRAWLRLHPVCFSPVFFARQINNVYFDTPHLDSYSENLAGISLRKKLRLRWYGSDPSQLKSTLELKCKQSLQGWKVSQKLEEPLSLQGHSWKALRAQIKPMLKPALVEPFERYSWPVLLNQYHREYYLSFDQQVRITLDFSIRAYDQRLSLYPNLDRFVLPSGKMVVEVKANREHQPSLSKALSGLPLRVGKHSKYALAMEAILG